MPLTFSPRKPAHFCLFLHFKTLIIMKNSIFYISVLILIIFNACTKVDEEDRKNVGTLTLPIASFYFTGNEGTPPVTVTFINTSEYSDQFLWTFHNGSTSSETNPTFTYTNGTGEDQTYLVTLKATDTNTGESNTRSKSVLIKSSK